MADFEQESRFSNQNICNYNFLWLNSLKNYTVYVGDRDYVYLQATGEEVDQSWREMVDQLEVGCSVC